MHTERGSFAHAQELSAILVTRLMEMEELDDYKPVELITAIGVLLTRMICLLTADKAAQIEIAENFGTTLTAAVKKVN